MTCWVCGKPDAVWQVTARKRGRPKTEADEGTPDLLVEFSACETCVPFTVASKGTPK
jgi:hypothetical protein